MKVGAQQPVAPSAKPEPPARLSLAEIAIYKKAPTLIEWTASQVRDSSDLRKIQPAESQDQLPEILDRVGQACARLFGDFPKVHCEEDVVSSASLEGAPPPHSKADDWVVSASRGREFRYTVIPDSTGDVPTFTEYRTDPGGYPIDAARLKDFPMVTSAYASSFLYFSQADQHDSRYRYFGTEMIRKRQCYVVGFAQDPDKARRFEEFTFLGKDKVLLLLQGLAWVDAKTFQILRVRSWLLAPRTDIHLDSQTITVDFFPAAKSETRKMVWMPREATVETHCRGYKVRNTHEYSNFQLFRVESIIKP